MGIKINYCTTCHAELNSTNWPKTKKDCGHYMCNQCFRVWSRAYYKKTREKRIKAVIKWKINHPLQVKMWREKRHSAARGILTELKVNGCSICGYNKCLRALEFHHVDPKDKKFLITQHNMGHSEKQIIDEFHKCILLCSNCHREIEEMERNARTNKI